MAQYSLLVLKVLLNTNQPLALCLVAVCVIFFLFNTFERLAE